MVSPHFRHTFTRWQGLLLLYPLLSSGLGIQFEMALCQIQTRALVLFLSYADCFFSLEGIDVGWIKTRNNISGFYLKRHCNWFPSETGTADRGAFKSKWLWCLLMRKNITSVGTFLGTCRYEDGQVGDANINTQEPKVQKEIMRVIGTQIYSS